MVEQSRWDRWLRWPGALIFLALAAPLGSTRGLGYGAAVAVFFLLVAGTLRFAVARKRGRERTWAECVLSFGTMVVVLIFLALGALGRSA